MGSCAWTRGRAIGRGSSATVSLATYLLSGEVFAVKSAELDRSQFLQREERILSQLDHRRIVSGAGHDVTTENGREFFNLFMEFVAGGTLSDAIRREGGRLEEPEIRTCTREILEGVAYLHSKRLVHCDIKGRNVLVGEEGAKIADLGCARNVDVTATAVSGTPLYMAPEVARGEEQGFAADVWSVGCTIIEMATGNPPWPETADPVSALFRIGHSDEVPEFPTWISSQAKDFLDKCLRRKPEERWTAVQLLNHPFLENSSPAPKPAAGSVPSISPKSILDLDFWDSLNESASVREKTQFESPGNSPAERMRLLAGGNSMSRRPNWAWEEDWITVRGNEEEQNPACEEMGGSDSEGDEQGLDCCRNSVIEIWDFSSGLVNDSCFDEGNSTSFVIREGDHLSDLVNDSWVGEGNSTSLVINEGDYRSSLVNDSWDDEGICRSSGDSFLCSWRGFVPECECDRDSVSCNPDLGTKNSFLFFLLIIAVTSDLLSLLEKVIIKIKISFLLFYFLFIYFYEAINIPSLPVAERQRRTF